MSTIVALVLFTLSVVSILDLIYRSFALLLLLFVQEVEVIEGAKALLQQKVNEAFEQLW